MKNVTDIFFCDLEILINKNHKKAIERDIENSKKNSPISNEYSLTKHARKNSMNFKPSGPYDSYIHRLSTAYDRGLNVVS